MEKHQDLKRLEMIKLKKNTFHSEELDALDLLTPKDHVYPKSFSKRKTMSENDIPLNNS